MVSAGVYRPPPGRHSRTDDSGRTTLSIHEVCETGLVELATLEQAIRDRHGAARMEAQLELSWALVQTDCDRSLDLAEEVIVAETSSQIPVPERARLQARALVCRSNLFWGTAQFHAAREDAENALRVMGADEDHPWRSRALNSLGAIAFLQQVFTEARTHFEDAADLVRRHGGESAILMNNLGLIDMSQGRYSDALPKFREA
jgi:hypothetical protein